MAFKRLDIMLIQHRYRIVAVDLDETEVTVMSRREIVPSKRDDTLFVDIIVLPMTRREDALQQHVSLNLSIVRLESDNIL